jgi:hypothetical protein
MASKPRDMGVSGRSTNKVGEAPSINAKDPSGAVGPLTPRHHRMRVILATAAGTVPPPKKSCPDRTCSFKDNKTDMKTPSTCNCVLRWPAVLQRLTPSRQETSTTSTTTQRQAHPRPAAISIGHHRSQIERRFAEFLEAKSRPKRLCPIMTGTAFSLDAETGTTTSNA